jgi:multiple sugar transport system ATP-binding protein
LPIFAEITKARKQIDTPMNLYMKPANLFVATFLGSPGMNVLRGYLRQDNGLVIELAGGARVALTDAQVPDEWLDREFDVGVRPEHLLPVDEASAFSFAPEVEVVERVGNEVFLYLRHGSLPLVMRSSPQLHVVAPGDRLNLQLSAQHLHFFDVQSGCRLPLSA